MSPQALVKFLCGLILTISASAYGQYGYVPQGAPPAGAGLMPGPGGAQVMDPYMGMAPAQSQMSPAMSPGVPMAPTTAMYGGPAYAPQQAYNAPSGSSLLSYGQLEAQYRMTSFKKSSIEDSSGIEVGLMAQLFNPFFIHATVDWASAGGSKSKSYDFSTITVGMGGYFALSVRFHVVAEVGGLYSSLSPNKESVSFSDGAIYVNPSIRFAATNDLELQAGLTLTSADNYDSSTFDLGGYYRLFSQMDIGLGASFGDVTNNYHLGVRFRW